MFLLFFMEEFRVEEDHVSPPRPWHTWDAIRGIFHHLPGEIASFLSLALVLGLTWFNLPGFKGGNTLIPSIFVASHPNCFVFLVLCDGFINHLTPIADA
jgi:hypothetical protein